MQVLIQQEREIRHIDSLIANNRLRIHNQEVTLNRIIDNGFPRERVSRQLIYTI